MTATPQTHSLFPRRLLRALALLAALLSSAAGVSSASGAEKAPAKSSAAKGPSLLIIAKPGDKYAPDVLRALENIFDKTPALLDGLKVSIALSRLDDPAQVQAFKKRAAPRWAVTADSGDELYRRHRIVATPTVLILGEDRKVIWSHPGYDPGLAEDVRTALAKARGIALPEAMTADAKPAKPNMALQLGRRLAARGLWENALPRYEEAAKQGPLPPEAQLELAEIHVEMNNPEAAQAVLNALPAAQRQTERAQALAKRAQALKAGQAGKPTPPVVKR